MLCRKCFLKFLCFLCFSHFSAQGQNPESSEYVSDYSRLPQSAMVLIVRDAEKENPCAGFMVGISLVATKVQCIGEGIEHISVYRHGIVDSQHLAKATGLAVSGSGLKSNDKLRGTDWIIFQINKPFGYDSINQRYCFLEFDTDRFHPADHPNTTLIFTHFSGGSDYKIIQSLCLPIPTPETYSVNNKSLSDFKFSQSGGQGLYHFFRHNCDIPDGGTSYGGPIVRKMETRNGKDLFTVVGIHTGSSYLEIPADGKQDSKQNLSFQWATTTLETEKASASVGLHAQALLSYELLETLFSKTPWLLEKGWTMIPSQVTPILEKAEHSIRVWPYLGEVNTDKQKERLNWLLQLNTTEQATSFYQTIHQFYLKLQGKADDYKDAARFSINIDTEGLPFNPKMIRKSIKRLSPYYRYGAPSSIPPWEKAKISI